MKPLRIAVAGLVHDHAWQMLPQFAKLPGVKIVGAADPNAPLRAKIRKDFGVDAVYADWGTATQKRLGRVTAQELRSMDFPAGSMGPKVEAAAGFVEATGRRAAIGGLEQIEQIVNGTAGTQVVGA